MDISGPYALKHAGGTRTGPGDLQRNIDSTWLAEINEVGYTGKEVHRGSRGLSFKVFLKSAPFSWTKTRKWL
jgi:hypothetical protein